jgi:cobalt-zinc-cadmium efflux system membrane fusion protein
MCRCCRYAWRLLVQSNARVTPRLLRAWLYPGSRVEFLQMTTSMKSLLQPKRKTVAAIAVVAIVAVLLLSGRGQLAKTNTPVPKSSAANSPQTEATVDLSSSQLNAIKIAPVETYFFPVEKEAVGSISFADDLSVQVYPSYQGKIIESLVELGDEVRKGQPLFTIDSPDLIQAESTLIGAAATLELTSKEMARAKDLYATNVGVPQRELEQAISDQQTAEGALKAARDAVRVFGKSETQIDQIIASRKIDPTLVVPSPISGQITAFNGPPGLLVQPGNPPAPYTVADVCIKWMLANVVEIDLPAFHVGQPVQVKVAAYADRLFHGKISKIYAAVDPDTHRAIIRSEVTDSRNELRPGMLANFVIRVQNTVDATAIPANGVVRESDGSMTAWVTTDRRRFVQRVIKTGLQRDGRVQVLDGLRQGEFAVTDGALFLSNMLQAPPTD